MKKEKKHILCLQFKNRSTFALDGRINGVKDMVNADVHTAASRRTDIMDGMNDSPIAGFVKSCLPPPPVLTEGYNLFHIRSACRRLVQPVSMRTHFFVTTPTHTALQPIRTAHAPRWVTLHRYPSKPAAFSSHLMTAGADAQPSGRKPANMPYAEPLQGSTTCNPEGFFSPLLLTTGQTLGGSPSYCARRPHNGRMRFAPTTL